MPNLLIFRQTQNETIIFPIPTFRKIAAYPKYAKAIEWGRLITITGGAQVIVQVAGLVCGILIVRLLPTQEYALYTIANTMLGTMTVLADSGISRGVMALGGKTWQDKKQLGDVMATGLLMRKKFALISLLIATPILAYLLIHQNASILTSTLIILSIIPAFYAALSDTILEITPKLHQDLKPLQKNQLQVSILRLLLTCLLLFIFPLASLAIICSGIPRAYGNIQLKKIAGKFTEKGVYNKDVEEEITKTVKRIMPTAIFFCLTGQITVWLMSISGNTTGIAEIGALGRITALFTLFTTVYGILIIPRYARLESNKALLVKSYFGILIFTLITLSIICVITYFFSHQFLTVLGRNYYGLETELFLYVLTTCVGLLSNLHNSLSASRGWFMRPTINVSFELIILISGIFIFDLSTLQGIILYNFYLYSAYLIQYIIYLVYCLNTKIGKT